MIIMEKVARACTWFERSIENCGDRAPDEDKICLPLCYKKGDMFHNYQSDMLTFGLTAKVQLWRKALSITCGMNHPRMSS